MPSAVSSSAGWREPRWKCDERCQEERIKCCKIAVVSVGENGELCTINVCTENNNQRREERSGAKANHWQWKCVVGEKGSRGKLAVGLDSLSLDHKIPEINAGKKMYARNLQEENIGGTESLQKVGQMSHHKEELAFLQVSKNMQLPSMTVRKAIQAE